jgi:hypothetical protein
LRGDFDGDHNLDAGKDLINKKVRISKAVSSFTSLEVGTQFDKYLSGDECQLEGLLLDKE